MRLATRITIGVLAVELVALGVLLLLADRWQDMRWPALGMDRWVVGLGFALPPLVVLTAVALGVLAGMRIAVAEVGAWRGRRREESAEST
ncbi:hypothetical protein [Clavibacter capsici]|uniref:Uncharacterized protein n=1 Tax=Clavibacter capsici TaxID=1874630 RepID=A0AAE7CAQ1_9MICO|nr:hypothetical protein [Clavibacter capsici]ALD11744.1 hypothetical protein AES38_01120 [Clavibacter capsici]QIS38106.1 hypothetical protein GW572_01155 [Clavibacter capsici]QIS43798.1 hypothetical protein GW570_01125 [Clavibacter capsici]